MSGIGLATRPIEALADLLAQALPGVVVAGGVVLPAQVGLHVLEAPAGVPLIVRGRETTPIVRLGVVERARVDGRAREVAPAPLEMLAESLASTSAILETRAAMS